MKPRRRTSITREGWQYLLIFALVFGGALVNDVNLLLILGSMLAGPLLLSRHLAMFTLRGLVVQRRLPRAVCAGDLLVVHLAISNTRRRVGSWILVLEEPIRRLTGGRESNRGGDPQSAALPARWQAAPRGLVSEASVLFPYVPARQTCKGDYRGRLTQRGRYRLGPLRLSTRFPFGLFRYWMNCGTSATLTVLPRLGRLTQSWNALRHESFAGNDRREHRPGIDGDFYGLRPWQRGDSRRWIHWRTSARAGGVMVRQFEQPHSRDAAIVLDLWQPADADATGHPAGHPVPRVGVGVADNVELAVSFAATLAAELCRKGSSDVFLAAADPEPRLTGGPGSAALLQDLMERLALVDAQSRDRVPELLQLAVSQIEPGTEIVLVSTRPIDLTQADYAGKLSHDVARRISGRGMRMVDTSSPDLAQFFQPE
jgi:uncharacterized protein (DUF58 family)